MLLAAACSSHAPPPPPGPRPQLPGADAVRAQLAGLPFDDFVDRSFRLLLQRSPETVTDLGLTDIDLGGDFLDDISDAFTRETAAIDQVILDQLGTYAQLDEDEATTRDIYAWYLDDLIRGQAVQDVEPKLSGTITAVQVATELFFTDVQPLTSQAQVDAYITRLADVPHKLDGVIATLQRLETAGIVYPAPLLDAALDDIGAVASADPAATPYYTAFAARVSDGDEQQYVRDAIRAAVIPAYQRLQAEAEHLRSIAPTAPGVGTQPGGAAYYAWALRHHVTTDVTADEVHQLGLSELDRIHGEMDAAFAALGYPAGASRLDNLARAATAAGVVPGDMLVDAYQRIIDDAQQRLPAAFDLLPTSTVRVKAGTLNGVYLEASLDNSRPATFFAGAGATYRIGMRTLAYHETVPGHHEQIGVAHDLPLPLVRRVATFTGYVEGWALYAEWLASDLGWYAGDELSDVGRIQAEAFRAARLVVDTGLHAQGWTMEQAVTFLANETGYGQAYATSEILRYMAWPGQATAYFTGFKHLRALRTSAEAAAGFDLKRFHHAVLARGSVPLELLDALVARDLGF